MKKFIENVKDFFYDATDYILIILIIIGVVFIIGWRLDILFAGNSNETKIESTINQENKNNENIESNEKNMLKESNNEISITIPEGSVCQEIADLLLENEIIEDKDKFLKKAKELNVETKLKCGEFKINKNSSLEEILKILSK